MTSKPNVVFLPGLLDNYSMWNHQVEGLQDYCNPILLDLVNQSSVIESAQWVLDSTPENFALVGFSMGGYVAFEMLRQAPHRIQNLALISTSARADDPNKIELRRDMIDRAESGDYNALVKELIPNVIHPSRKNDHTLTDAIHKMALEIGYEAFVRQLKVIMSRPDSRHELSSISCPTLVVVGNDDLLTPPELSREMAQGIPDAELIIINECNHYTPMEQPSQVTKALRNWL